MLYNNSQNGKLRQHASVIQRRVATSMALFMTVLFLCVEHVRAFSQQYHLSAHDAMVLASAASSLTRKFSSKHLSGDHLKKTFPARAGIFNSPGSSGESARGSATKLSMTWSSMPSFAISMPTLPTMPSSRELPFHALGSWYSEHDPTTKPPLYDDEYDFSFSSPTDDWPSMSVEKSEPEVAQNQARRGPFTAIRRVGGRVANRIPHFPRSA